MKGTIAIISSEMIARGLTLVDKEKSANCKGCSEGDIHSFGVSDEKALHLSFRGIREIENLTGLGMLIELKLNNNRIKEMRGLSQLIHLRRLNLSFNLIQKIEGLESLNELIEVSFANNKIKNASGLANCHKIEYLSLGRNDIDSIDNDEYGIGNQLRHLTSLRNLNLTDNPITITEGYVSKISSYLPSLIYLDNEKITLKTF